MGLPKVIYLTDVESSRRIFSKRLFGLHCEICEILLSSKSRRASEADDDELERAGEPLRMAKSPLAFRSNSLA